MFFMSGFLLICAVLFSVALHIHHFEQVRIPFLDEPVYVHQANTIVQEGPLHGIRTLVINYNKTPGLWKFPPPTRVGNIWLSGLAMKLVGNTDMKVVSSVSLLATILSFFLILAIGIRFFNRWITLYVLLLFAISPVSLALSCSALQDALVSFLGLLIIYSTLEMGQKLSGKLTVWTFSLVIFGSIGAITKGSLLLIYLISSTWLIGLFILNRITFIHIMRFISCIVIGLLFSQALLVYVVGGVQPLISV